jgi:hypothetical protein
VLPNSPRQILFTHGGGRFANQIYNYAHLLALAYECGGEFAFVQMAFWQYASLLALGDTNPLCAEGWEGVEYPRLQWLRRWLDRWRQGNGSLPKRWAIGLLYAWYGHPLAHRTQAIKTNPQEWLLGRSYPGLHFTDPKVIALLRQARITCLSGFDLYDWAMVVKHGDKIRDRMQFHPQYQILGDRWLRGLRQRYRLLLGVMLRQGDYRTWLGGRYYFSPAQYAIWLTQVAELFPNYAPGEIGFVVASDEPQSLETFGDLPVHWTTGIAGGSGHYIESMVELAGCDRILTPPSSFGLWAAFMGNIPVIALVDAAQDLRRSSWVHPEDFDRLLDKPQLTIEEGNSSLL